MHIFQFALRNVMRNKRRSMITMGAIAMGFAAINLFGGYMDSTFMGLKRSVVYGEGTGHLTIFKKGFLTDGKLDPEKYMITSEELNLITALLLKNPSIQGVMPRLSVSGLISNGENSSIFIAQGARPADEATLKQDYPYDGEGARIDDGAPIGAQFGSDLAKMLDLKVGDTAVIMANTLSGQMNAMDVEVHGIYNTGMSSTNDKYLLLPLSLAQSLYDTTSVDRLVLMISDINRTETVRSWLTAQLPGIHFEAEIRSWDELSTFYTQVHALYNIIFLFISCIVLVIVVTSVINTMTMSVAERTQEIGTLRALGIKRRKVSGLFGAEGILIGLCGSAFGLLLTTAMIGAITAAHITYCPPGTSTTVAVNVNIVPVFLTSSGLFLIGLSWLASVMPSLRASRMKIVDALGHV